MTIAEYIDEAIKSNKEITIKYVKNDGTRSKRTISNVQYSEEYGYGKDYITGFCQLRKQQRTFKISRIIEVDDISNIITPISNKTVYTPKTAYVEPQKITTPKKVITPPYTPSSTNSTVPQRHITPAPTNTNPKTSTSTKSSEGCYIATMVYGDYNHPQVLVLRAFRDNFLKTRLWGRIFIHVYYATSPIFVKIFRNRGKINTFIRMRLDDLIDYIRKNSLM